MTLPDMEEVGGLGVGSFHTPPLRLLRALYSSGSSGTEPHGRLPTYQPPSCKEL